MAQARNITDEVPWRLAFETNPLAIGVSELASGRFVAVNDAFLRLYGYTRRQFIGHTYTQLGIWHHLTDRRKMVAGLRSKPIHSFLHVYRTRDGRVGRAWMTSTTLVHGGKHYVVSWVADLDKRDAEQKALRDTRALLNALFDNATGGYAHLRIIAGRGQPRDFVYLHANAMFQRLIRCRRVMGRCCSELGFPLRRFAPRLFDIAGKVARDGRPRQFTTQLADATRWYTISLFSPARGELVITLDDITERQRIEEELRTSNARLDLALRVTRVVVFQIGRAHV